LILPEKAFEITTYTMLVQQIERCFPLKTLWRSEIDEIRFNNPETAEVPAKNFIGDDTATKITCWLKIEATVLHQKVLNHIRVVYVV